MDSNKLKSSFTERVQRVVRDIPHGFVLRYADVARLAGSPGASRAVGTIMRNNTHKDLPCHRVVRADGSIGGYNGVNGPSKQQLLQCEGVDLTQVLEYLDPRAY